MRDAKRLAPLPLIFGGLLLIGSLVKAEPSSPPPLRPPDPLSEALPILQAKYIDARSIKPGEHLNELIAHSNGKISLNPAETTPAPILTALLPGSIIYWRLASFTPETNWADLTTQLGQWTQPETAGIILDLRSNVAPDDYEGAAKVAAFFVHPETLFYLKQGSVVTNLDQSKSQESNPSFNRPIVIITNNQTTGAAEALTACLKVNGALVVGRPTKGKAAMFEEQELSSGQVLRFAVGQVCLADGTPLWNHPVSPDIGLTINDASEKSALASIEKHAILDVIGEAAERRRMTEAALVQGEDPELDDYLASHEKKPSARHPAPPLFQDIALINALDSLKAIRISQRHLSSSPENGTVPEPSSSLR